MIPWYVVEFGLGALIGLVFGAAWELVTCKVLKIGRFAYIKGLHFHHSMFAPGAWVVLPWFTTAAGTIIAGVGIGVLVQHVIVEGKAGFHFITRELRSKTEEISR